MDQSNAKWILRDERVYEIDKTSPGAYRPLVVAITSKTSAQRLMAQLAEERGLQDQGRYRMFAFTHPTLPGLERGTIKDHFLGAPSHAELRAPSEPRHDKEE